MIYTILMSFRALTGGSHMDEIFYPSKLYTDADLTSPHTAQLGHFSNRYSCFWHFLTYFWKSEFLGSHRRLSHDWKIVIPLNCRAYWYRSNKPSLSSIRTFFDELSKFLTLFDGRTDRRTDGQTLLYSCWPQLKIKKTCLPIFTKNPYKKIKAAAITNPEIYDPKVRTYRHTDRQTYIMRYQTQHQVLRIVFFV